MVTGTEACPTKTLPVTKQDPEERASLQVGRASLPAYFRQAQRPVPPGFACFRKHSSGRAGVSACLRKILNIQVDPLI